MRAVLAVGFFLTGVVANDLRVEPTRAEQMAQVFDN
jgi:hypothetical protein